MAFAPVGRANLGRAVSPVCRGRPALGAARRPSPSPALRARRSATVRLRVWSRKSRPPPSVPSDRRPDPVGAVPSPLHRAGARPPGGGAEGRVESGFAVDSGDDHPLAPAHASGLADCGRDPGLGLRARPAPPLLGSASSRPQGLRRLQGGAAPGAAPDLKATARPGLAEVGVSQRGGSS